MGEGRRPETVAVADEDSHPEITLRQISAWSLAILAAVAAGFVLYAAREIMLPVVAAFVVGVMLGPAARRLEALHIPRPLVALLLVAGVTLIIRFGDPVDLPARVRAREWLAGHGRVAEGKAARIRRPDRGVAAFQLDHWRTSHRRRRGDSLTRDFLGSVDDLVLVAANHGLSFLSRRAAFGHLGMARLAARPRHDIRKPRFASDGAQDPQRNRIRTGQLSVDRVADQVWRRGADRDHLLR